MSDFAPWKIAHVEIRQPFSDLRADVGTGGLFVVLWCDCVPVGHLVLPADLLPISAQEVQANAAHLLGRALKRRIMKSGFPSSISGTNGKEAPDLAYLLNLKHPLACFSQLVNSDGLHKLTAAAPSVCVVVCTKNRPEALGKCLASLERLSPQPEEIIVVDNDPASNLTRPVTALFPNVRYVSEPRPGLSAARNAAIRSFKTDIIAFTDDDVMVFPGWIATIQKVFLDPSIIAMTGLVLPAELATEAQFAFQSDSIGWKLDYEPLDFDSTFFRRTSRAGVPVWQIGAGANMAFRREAFERVGLFDERLGAGAAGCSEDSELWYRLLAEGHQCRYEPAAVVSHFHRSDWKQLTDQTYSYMRGHVAALLFQFDKYGHWGNIRRAFLVLPRHFLRLLIESFKERLLTFFIGPNKNQRSTSPVGRKILGTIAGYTYYLRHRHRATDPQKPGAIQSRLP